MQSNAHAGAHAAPVTAGGETRDQASPNSRQQARRAKHERTACATAGGPRCRLQALSASPRRAAAAVATKLSVALWQVKVSTLPVHCCAAHQQTCVCTGVGRIDVSRCTSITSIRWPGASRQAALKPTTFSCWQAFSSSISCRNLAYDTQHAVFRARHAAASWCASRGNISSRLYK